MNRISGIRLLLLCALQLVCIAAGAETLLALNEAERRWVEQNRTITVGYEQDWPPFDFARDGRPQGYSIDLIHLIADKAGLAVEFREGPTWKDLLTQLRDGRIDVMPAIYTTESRRKTLAFTDSYFSQPSVIVVRQANRAINNFDDLAGKTLASVEGFAISHALQRDFPEIDVRLYPTVIDCLTAVATGEVDAYIDSIGLVTFALNNNFVPNLRIIGDVQISGLSNPPMHMAVRKDEPILRSILDKGLDSITTDEKQLLTKKWLTPNDYEKRLIFTEEQTRWIRQHPTVRVALDPDYPPYSFRDDNGRYAGIAVDFLDLLSDKTSIQFEPVSGLDWRGMLRGLKEKRVDMGAPIVQTPRREEFLNFSIPIISAPLVIMTRDGADDIATPADLDGRRVALVEGYSSSQRVIREHPAIDKHWVQSPLEGLQAVSAGEADAFVSVIGVNIYLSQQHGINNLQVAGTYDLHFDGQRFAIRSDWPELVVLINKALGSITPEQRAAIRERWISIPDKREIDYRLLWQVVAVFLAVLLVMLFYNRRLSREIDRRERAERDLVASNQRLTSAREAADRANQSKSRFVSAVSHELKTPLNAIVGFSDLLLRDERIQGDTRQQLQMIADAGRHLDSLISDLLDLSRLEAGRMEFDIQPVNLEQCLEEALTLTHIAAEQRGIAFRNLLATRPPPTVLADPVRLKQILLNLLSNAVKYNVDNGTVALDWSRTGDGWLTMTITDSGIGIERDKFDQLFEFFDRAGAEFTAVAGSGVGLALSKHLVEAMRGQIGLDSKVGEGTTFWFTLPLA